MSRKKNHLMYLAIANRFCYGPDDDGGATTETPPVTFDVTKVDENFNSEDDAPVQLTQKQLSTIIGGIRTKVTKRVDDTTKKLQDVISQSTATQADRDRLNEILTQSRSEYENKLTDTAAKLTNLQTQLAATQREKDEQVSAWRKRFEATVMDIEVTKACDTHGVYSPSQMRGILDRNLQVSEVVDAEGKGTGNFEVVVKSKNDKNEPINIKVTDYIKSMDESGEHPNLFKHQLKEGLNAGHNGKKGAAGAIEAPTNPEELEKWLKDPKNREEFLNRKTV